MESKELVVNQRVKDWIDNNPDVIDSYSSPLHGFIHEMNAFLHSEIVLSPDQENGYGFCPNCMHHRRGEYLPIYRMRFWSEAYEDYDLSNSYGCADCIEQRVIEQFLPREFRVYQWGTGMFFDKSTFPKPTVELHMCVSCNRGITPDTARSPYATYAGVHAKDKDNNVVLAHQQCSFYCSHCNNWRVRTPTITGYTSGVGSVSYDNETTCDICWEKIQEDNPDYTSCDACGTYVTYELRESRINSEDICNRCYDSEYRCGSCDTWYCDGDDHDCDQCEEDNRPQYIHSYSFKPRADFFGKAQYHFGIELEVEAKKIPDNYHDGSKLAYEMVGRRAYLKHDGSLSNGFEIVTHPHSLQEIQENFPWSLLDDLQDLGFRSWSTSTCGLHVHVSRTAFAGSTPEQRDTHQIKFMKLIYDNKDQVQKLAGRKSSWAKFDDKGQIIRKVKMGYQSANRYSAVNVENENTLEVRVFRGSLRKERVLSAVEFVHAAVEYTRDLKIVPKEEPFAWTSFLGFVTANKTTYPNLLTIVNEILSKSSTTISRQEETV